MIEISSESKTPATFVILARCKPLEMPVLALYQTKPPNAGIVLREAFKKKTAIIVTLSLSHFTPTLPKEIGTVIIGTKST